MTPMPFLSGETDPEAMARRERRLLGLAGAAPSAADPPPAAAPKGRRLVEVIGGNDGDVGGGGVGGIDGGDGDGPPPLSMDPATPCERGDGNGKGDGKGDGNGDGDGDGDGNGGVAALRTETAVLQMYKRKARENLDVHVLLPIIVIGVQL